MTDTNASRDRPKSVPGPSLSGTVLDPRTAGSSSLHLFRRARRGDSSALDALFARHLPRLRRWAHGRLPKWARSVADTTDLVQDVLLQTFRRLANFEPRRDQALQAYLRMAIDNRSAMKYVASDDVRLRNRWTEMNRSSGMTRQRSTV